MRILIAEDDYLNMQFLQAVLKEHGQCSGAPNGREAVQAYCQAVEDAAPFDVIFMDIMMPVLSGLDALERIREFERANAHRIPRPAIAVMVTATSVSQDVVRSYSSGGAFAYLVKPIQAQDIDQVMARIKTQLETPAAP